MMNEEEKEEEKEEKKEKKKKKKKKNFWWGCAMGAFVVVSCSCKFSVWGIFYIIV